MLDGRAGHGQGWLVAASSVSSSPVSAVPVADGVTEPSSGDVRSGLRAPAAVR